MLPARRSPAGKVRRMDALGRARPIFLPLMVALADVSTDMRFAAEPCPLPTSWPDRRGLTVARRV
jgi:hypothetical protein